MESLKYGHCNPDNYEKFEKIEFDEGSRPDNYKRIAFLKLILLHFHCCSCKNNTPQMLSITFGV